MRIDESLLAGIPDEARVFLQEMGYLEPDPLTPGARIEPIRLGYLDRPGDCVLGEGYGRPVVLIFGSYT